MRSINEEIKEQEKRGVLCVLTGPSGAGKDAVIKDIIGKHSNVTRIVTTTTRQKREHEQEGKDYYFITREEFERKIAEHLFYEWVEYRGELYGTEKDVLTKAIASGQDVIWRIDTKGVKNIKEKVKNHVPRSVFVFITTPTIEELEQRILIDEGQHRTHRWSSSLSTWEREQFMDFEYLIVNEQNKLPKAVSQLIAIIEAKRIEIILRGD